MFKSLLLTLAALVGTSSGALKDCAAGTSLFTLTSYSLDPANPVAGDKAILHLEYQVPEGLTVTGGTTTYKTTLNYIPFAPSTEPLCQDIPCPLGPGLYKNDSIVEWPSGVTGSFTSTMTWADESGTVLACLEMSGRLGAATYLRNAAKS
jgi:hypothetical protein